METSDKSHSGTEKGVLAGLAAKFWEILKHKDPPHKVALGMALGVFVGFLPIMGIQMAVVTLVALPFRANIKAAVLAVWLSNPVTFIPLYWANYKFGLLFTPRSMVSWHEFAGQMKDAANWNWTAVWDSFLNLLSIGADVFIPLWTGSAVLGVLFGAASYIVTYRWVVFYRAKKARPQGA